MQVTIQELSETIGISTTERFPSDFMFQLSQEEFETLRSQFVILKGKGGRHYFPYFQGYSATHDSANHPNTKNRLRSQREASSIWQKRC
ncbi:MAG: ORF6N domain-containing protein [Pseudomonadota bacterium]